MNHDGQEPMPPGDKRRARVLVTGGYGFLGQHLVRLLHTLGHEVVAPAHCFCDLLNAHEVNGCIAEQQPEIVYHLAAVCGGIGANRAEPARFLRDNAIMGLNVLEACANAKPMPKLIMVGTTCSYPRDCPLPFREEDLWNGYPEPTNAPYGVAKRLLLTAAQAYREQYGLSVVTVVPTNLYGPGDNFDPRKSHVIPALISRMDYARRENIPALALWGDGTPTRDFLYVEDCARALVMAAQAYDSPAPVNLGSGREISTESLAAMIARLVGYGGQITWDLSYPNGQPRRRLDSTRAHALLGWQASTSLEVGLRRTVQWRREQLCAAR